MSTTATLPEFRAAGTDLSERRRSGVSKGPVIDLVLGLKRRGLTIVIIEHNMQVIMRLADRILALHAGRRIAFGAPEEVRSDPAVVDAYLGTVDHAA